MERAFLGLVFVAILIAAVAAIGLEHLLIWLWHHVSIKWS